MKISEIITDKYKLRIPPTVYYDLLADVLDVEEEQEPKIGHWIDADSKSFEFHRVYKCSECGNTEIEYPEGIYRHFRYCPNCGCHTVESQESEDKEDNK